VGSIPTHSRQFVLPGRRNVRRLTRASAALVAALAVLPLVARPCAVRAQAADSTTAPATPDERAQLKETLQNMSRSEVAGATEWERRKNPRVAMLCSAVLPGLGQTYNGRRLKVGVMVGFASFYAGNMILSWQAHERALATRDLLEPNTTAWNYQNRLADYNEEKAKDFLWWSGAVWLIGILDAWADAHTYDVRAYEPHTPEHGGASIDAGADGGGVFFEMRIDF